MSDPLAYFLSWRTYGTWLHGDVRGSVDLDHNVYATAFLEPNPARHRWESRMRGSRAVLFHDHPRQTVIGAIEEHCRHKNWRLLALAVRTNHVHVLMSYPGIEPEPVMTALKSWSTRALRNKKLVEAGVRVWARHGSTRYLWNEENINAAGAYIVEGQDVSR